MLSAGMDLKTASGFMRGAVTKSKPASRCSWPPDHNQISSITSMTMGTFEPTIAMKTSH